MRATLVFILAGACALAACNKGGSDEPEVNPDRAACEAVIAANEAEILAAVGRAITIHEASGEEPAVPRDEVDGFDVPPQHVSTIFGALEGNPAVVRASVRAYDGEQMPVARFGVGVRNSTSSSMRDFDYTLGEYGEVEVNIGDLTNIDTDEETPVCYFDVVRAFGDQGSVEVSFTLAR